ncbi:uncharacterized protein N0V89_000059 [Didymosphaeria variabile]|uniref:Ap4A phosphorylase II n=1 Tax=Didymosphaeria variabile TaxID=1932322 RepID=A0A9W8XWP6_9PLEO|nr:uncharacterized protein N0V89_000059 [Didymosphaeria variabile]KAJ4359504.1 hypothetical protein N0V89_000059 [Didymosphaeria variabile]
MWPRIPSTYVPKHTTHTHSHHLTIPNPKFQFRIASSLAKKPQTATRHQRKVSNAFADDNPDFSLGLIGPTHKLILNKFCVVRPQFVLHTVEFEPQQTPLSLADLGALWSVLGSLQSEHLAIFNCGADAGASVGHKHMQVLPHPGREAFELFPDGGELGDDIWVNEEVPFRHAVQKLPKVVDADALVTVYQKLRNYLSLEQGTPHNVILTKRWFMVVPRRVGRIADGEMAANAAVMVGMVWMTKEREYELWTRQDPMEFLPEFGVPR